MTELTESLKEEICGELSRDIGKLHVHLAMYKPNDKSELDRNFAVAMTELEKLKAYLIVYIINPLSE